ncbi:hypothetical protein ACFE04_028000 [Oxalis oulophora]
MTLHNMFDILPEAMLIQIFILLLTQDPAAFGMLRQSSKKMLKVANDPMVVQKIDMNRIVPRLRSINNAGRSYLAILSKHNVKSSSLLIATDMFFIQMDRGKGLNLLLDIATKENYQAKYNCAIAMIVCKHEYAKTMFEEVWQSTNNKQTLQEMRSCLHKMLPINISRRFHFPHCCMHNNLANGNWQNSEEIHYDCIHCSMDMELYKLKTMLI